MQRQQSEAYIEYSCILKALLFSNKTILYFPMIKGGCTVHLLYTVSIVTHFSQNVTTRHSSLEDNNFPLIRPEETRNRCIEAWEILFMMLKVLSVSSSCYHL